MVYHKPVNIAVPGDKYTASSLGKIMKEYLNDHDDEMSHLLKQIESIHSRPGELDKKTITRFVIATHTSKKKFTETFEQHMKSCGICGLCEFWKGKISKSPNRSINNTSSGG